MQESIRRIDPSKLLLDRLKGNDLEKIKLKRIIDPLKWSDLEELKIDLEKLKSMLDEKAPAGRR